MNIYTQLYAVLVCCWAFFWQQNEFSSTCCCFFYPIISIQLLSEHHWHSWSPGSWGPLSVFWMLESPRLMSYGATLQRQFWLLTHIFLYRLSFFLQIHLHFIFPPIKTNVISRNHTETEDCHKFPSPVHVFYWKPCIAHRLILITTGCTAILCEKKKERKKRLGAQGWYFSQVGVSIMIHVYRHTVFIYVCVCVHV